MFKKRLSLVVAALIWAISVGAGFRALLVYSYTPGASPTSSKAWPVRTEIRPMKDRARLLVFAHPQCACSHATVQELAVIMAQSRDQVDAYVLFLAPPSERQNWVQGALWREAAAIPGIRVIEDSGGMEARLFGASTSGQAFLYDSSGRLLFKGGITAARGHAGANAGSDAILSLLRGRTVTRKVTPVFGCSLQNESGS